MAGKLLVACFLSAALAFLLLVSSGADVQATTFKVNYTPFTLVCDGPDGLPGTGDDTCTCATGGAYDLDECSDLATTFQIPATAWGTPDHAQFASINTFHAPPEWGQGPSDAAPVGAYAGLLYSNTTLSIANGECPAGPNIQAPIPLYHCSTDNSPGNQIIWDVGTAGANLTQDNDADTVPDGCNKYPDHIDALAGGRKPFVRLYSYMPIVAGSPPTQINFVVFQPGQLTMDKDGVPATVSPDQDLGDSLGYSNMVVRDNPLVPEIPQAITEFCAPLGTNTWLWGTSGGEGVGIPQVGPNPELGIFCLNWKAGAGGANKIGVDDDGDTVADDGCWVVTDWCGDGVDNDADTQTDEMCGTVVHHNPNAAVGGATGGIWNTATHLIGCFSEGQPDADNDGFTNDVDACPETFSTYVDPVCGCDGCPDGTCPRSGTPPFESCVSGGNEDAPGDGYMNRQDRCPFVGDDQADSDGDLIGDACDSNPSTPDGVYVNEMPRGAVCVGDTDTDGDGWCDTTENIVASEVLSDWNDQFSTPEYIALDYPVSSAVNPPGAAPGTCSDQTYYASAGDPNAGGVALVDNDGDDVTPGSKTNANDPNCAALASDTDQDGVPNASDNCPTTPNPEQLNIDGDSAGDACDLDDDCDGINDYDEWEAGTIAKNWCSRTNLPFDNSGPTGPTPDGHVTLLDVLAYKPELGGTNPLFDHAGPLGPYPDGQVTLLDVLGYKPNLNCEPCPYTFG